MRVWRNKVVYKSLFRHPITKTFHVKMLWMHPGQLVKTTKFEICRSKPLLKTIQIVSPSTTDLACVRLLNRRKRLKKMQRKRAGNSLTTTSAVCHFLLFHLSTMIHYTLPAGLVFQIDFFFKMLQILCISLCLWQVPLEKRCHSKRKHNLCHISLLNTFAFIQSGFMQSRVCYKWRYSALTTWVSWGIWWI